MKQSILFQRIEGAALLVVSFLLYASLELNILIFFLTILLIDIFMVGYILNDRLGAYIYNLGHTITVPLLIGFTGYHTDSSFLLAISLIWFAHIGMDRAFGYGLKLESGFKDTHLGRIGKK